MIACRGFTANGLVNIGVYEPSRQWSIQQEVIDAQPSVALPALAHVIPIRIYTFGRVLHADGVEPSLI